MKKVLFLFKCIYSHIYYRALNYFGGSYIGCYEDSNYIISLTSYYKRFDDLYLVVESLLRQSLKPKCVIVFLSKEDIDLYGGLPKNIEKMQTRGVNIEICEGNYKSYKKLSYIIPFIRNDNDLEYVITADDDIFYPSKWSIQLMNKSLGKVVSCFRGHDLVRNEYGFDYNISMKSNISGNTPSFKLLPTGCSGICYPVDSIYDDMIANFDLIEKLSPDADDIWYKGVTLSRKYKCSRVLKKNVHFPLVISSLKDSLYSDNVFNNKNSKKIDDVFDFFKLNDFFC